MPSATQSLIRSVLQESGPLSINDLVAACLARGSIESRNPKTTIRNALTSDALLQSTADGRYVYLPAVATGASVRLPVPDAANGQGRIAAGGEVVAVLLQQIEAGEPGPARSLALADGPTVTVRIERGRGPVEGRVAAMTWPLVIPPPFWQWWAAQRRAGADEIVIRCEDGLTGQYTAAPIKSATLDRSAVGVRNTQMREAAAAALRNTRGMRAHELGRRLLARGVYHGKPPPDPLNVVLFEPPGPFLSEFLRITYRPEMTPAQHRLFADRIDVESDDERLLGALLGLSPPPTAAPPRKRRRRPARSRRPTHAYHIRVRLQWAPSVWRTFELLDTHTLEDLHDAIQDAFGWDDDHLYSFFLSNRAWDSLTEVSRPFNDVFGDEPEPPTADEVTLAELELQPKQRFLYIFDFGDDLRHEIEVRKVLSAAEAGAGPAPRVVEAHGEPPPQYAAWDDEDGAWDEDEEGDEDRDQDEE